MTSYVCIYMYICWGWGRGREREREDGVKGGGGDDELIISPATKLRFSDNVHLKIKERNERKLHGSFHKR